MSSLIQQALKQERARRKDSGQGSVKALYAMLSPIQRQFIDDPHRFKLARCSRRSGKTFADAVYMVLECLKVPRTPVLYIGLTRESAKEAVWETLLLVLDSLKIGYEARPSALTIKFANGSRIRLFGADTPNAKNRLRGQKFKLVIIDECGFFQAMDSMIPAIIPTLADYEGSLVMTSSPGVLLSGFFYESDVGNNKENWRQYSWTLRDNPYFQKPASNPRYVNRAEEELDLICKTLYGGDTAHPAFVREYLGEWVRDNTSLVYPHTDQNIVPEAPKLHREQYAIGIDLGVTSASAIVVVKYSQYDRRAVFVDEWQASEVLIDDFADILKDFIDRYSPTTIVADTGGLGAAVVQELRRRYSLPIKAADKQDKAFYQRIFANDLISKYILAKSDLVHLLEGWSKIVKDEEGDEVKGQNNHTADAALYIYRYIYMTYLKDYEKPLTDDQIMLQQLTQSALREKHQLEEDALDVY